MGLVAFRDHPPQDHTYITKNFGFSSDIAKVQKDLSGLYASGGGDGPEAVTAAMFEALNMDWREEASKMVRFSIFTKPAAHISQGRSHCRCAAAWDWRIRRRCVPHLTINPGLTRAISGFDDGSPDNNDPLQLARVMASRGITLVSSSYLNISRLTTTQFFVACEPALSGYSVSGVSIVLRNDIHPDPTQYATDFYRAITNITSGLMLPLTTADLLAHAIVGSVLENLDMDRLVREVGHAVAQRILGNNESVDDVARELHEKLLLRNESTKKVVIESIYKDSEESRHNVQVYTQAATLAEARPELKRVCRLNPTSFFFG